MGPERLWPARQRHRERHLSEAVSLPGSTATILATDSSSYHMLAVVIPAPRPPPPAFRASVVSPTYGQTETLTATVTGSDGGGTVKFTDGGSTLTGCSAVALTASGRATRPSAPRRRSPPASTPWAPPTPATTTLRQHLATALGVNVAPAPLTVTASSGRTVYGGGPGAGDPLIRRVRERGHRLVTHDAGRRAHHGVTPPPRRDYPTSCSGAADPNYAITYAAGVMTVGPAPFSVAASSGTMTYGGSVPGDHPDRHRFPER